MKNFSCKDAVCPQLERVRCNVCGITVEQNELGYWDDYLSLSKDWGFHSPFDGESHKWDVCVVCYRAWIDKFEIPPDGTNSKTDAMPA